MDHTATDSASATGPPDATLVTEAIGGDRASLGAIYDRYANRVHTMCAHMLGDRDEAADTCAEVFLVAFQRLDQLRDRDRLKPWLFAIARHEVYRRTKQRRRIQLTGEVDEMDRIATRQQMSEVDERTVDPGQLALVIRDAASGLDDRDRLVLELQLQGLDGDDLAAALGTSASTAYQHVHRMKDRLERSLGAVLVARQGRADCADLDGLLGDWDGQFSVLWRKRVARHVDGCEVCERRRQAVPAALLGGVAAAAPMVSVSSVSAAPASLREQVLRDARVGTGGTAWSADGFPPAGLPVGDDSGDEIGDEIGDEPGQPGVETSSARSPVAVGVVAFLVVLLLGAALVLWQPLGGSGGRTTTADAISDPVVTTTLVPQKAVPEEVVPFEQPILEPPVAVDPGATTTTIVLVAPPFEVPGAVSDPDPDPDPGLQDPVTPAEPRTPPNARILVAPGVVYHPTAGFPDCGASTEFVVVAPTAVSVALVWNWAGQSGSSALVPRGAEWVGVLEVPAGVTGPLEVRAFAIDGFGTPGLGDVLLRSVEDCIAPG